MARRYDPADKLPNELRQYERDTRPPIADGMLIGDAKELSLAMTALKIAKRKKNERKK